MSTTDWRHSIHGKIISIILTFALAFSFIPLSAYADEPEANDAPANALSHSYPVAVSIFIIYII